MSENGARRLRVAAVQMMCVNGDVQPPHTHMFSNANNLYCKTTALTKATIMGVCVSWAPTYTHV